MRNRESQIYVTPLSLV